MATMTSLCATQAYQDLLVIKTFFLLGTSLAVEAEIIANCAIAWRRRIKGQRLYQRDSVGADPTAVMHIICFQ